MELKSFLEKYQPTDTIPAGDEVLARYREIVPASLVELWKAHGFGKYNNGIIEIVNPDEYRDTLEMWLGKKVDNYVPVALGAFGDLFYYRKLTETDEDVCVLDPHFRKIHNIVWSLNDFFNDFLTDEEIMSRNLMGNMLKEAKERLGELQRNEIYIFTPALAIGGAGKIDGVDKGNAQVHLSLLFQL